MTRELKWLAGCTALTPTAASLWCFVHTPPLIIFIVGGSVLVGVGDAFFIAPR